MLLVHEKAARGGGAGGWGRPRGCGWIGLDCCLWTTPMHSKEPPLCSTNFVVGASKTPVRFPSSPQGRLTNHLSLGAFD